MTGFSSGSLKSAFIVSDACGGGSSEGSWNRGRVGAGTAVHQVATAKVLDGRGQPGGQGQTIAPSRNGWLEAS